MLAYNLDILLNHPIMHLQLTLVQYVPVANGWQHHKHNCTFGVKLYKHTLLTCSVIEKDKALQGEAYFHQE